MDWANDLWEIGYCRGRNSICRCRLGFGEIESWISWMDDSVDGWRFKRCPFVTHFLRARAREACIDTIRQSIFHGHKKERMSS